MRRLLAVLCCSILASCASSKAYTGPVLPASELATFRGASTQCFGSNYIFKFDGRFEGQSLQAPSGTHSMEISHVSAPFVAEDANTSFIPECVQVTGFAVSFAAVAPRTYWFNVDDSNPTQPVLTVWESTGSGPSGVKIEAQVAKQWSHRDCFIDGRYAACFTGM
ncbi:MAG: hypothetical protein J0M12_14790 [Deltaproteobacteria bacterium]|nr:hypothetical protein [Deltaproteobacteria bacterium]